MDCNIISQQQVKELIFRALEKIKTTEVVKEDFCISDDTILLGMKGVLDSISFVAFVTDLEEKIEDITGKECIIKLQEIHDLNEGKDVLIVSDMTRLLAQVLQKNEEQ